MAILGRQWLLILGILALQNAWIVSGRVCHSCAHLAATNKEADCGKGTPLPCNTAKEADASLEAVYKSIKASQDPDQRAVSSAGSPTCFTVIVDDAADSATFRGCALTEVHVTAFLSKVPAQMRAKANTTYCDTDKAGGKACNSAEFDTSGKGHGLMCQICVHNTKTGKVADCGKGTSHLRPCNTAKDYQAILVENLPDAHKASEARGRVAADADAKYACITYTSTSKEDGSITTVRYCDQNSPEVIKACSQETPTIKKVTCTVCSEVKGAGGACNGGDNPTDGGDTGSTTTLNPFIGTDLYCHTCVQKAGRDCGSTSATVKRCINGQDSKTSKTEILDSPDFALNLRSGNVQERAGVQSYACISNLLRDNSGDIVTVLQCSVDNECGTREKMTCCKEPMGPDRGCNGDNSKVTKKPPTTTTTTPTKGPVPPGKGLYCYSCVLVVGKKSCTTILPCRTPEDVISSYLEQSGQSRPRQQLPELVGRNEAEPNTFQCYQISATADNGRGGIDIVYYRGCTDGASQGEANIKSWKSRFSTQDSRVDYCREERGPGEVCNYAGGNGANNDLQCYTCAVRCGRGSCGRDKIRACRSLEDSAESVRMIAQETNRIAPRGRSGPIGRYECFEVTNLDHGRSVRGCIDVGQESDLRQAFADTGSNEYAKFSFCNGGGRACNNNGRDNDNGAGELVCDVGNALHAGCLSTILVGVICLVGLYWNHAVQILISTQP